MTLIYEIKEHEGYRSHAYRDSLGVLTIGYGLNIDDGISEPLAAKILEWIVEERRKDLGRLLFPYFYAMTQARQDVLTNMAYNLGMTRFSKFTEMIKAICTEDVEGVCREMRDSKWAEQVGRRADYLIEKYRKG